MGVQSSTKTCPRSFRITYTQDNLLKNPSLKHRPSAIIRVLLQLYFNKRIPDIDALIEAEENRIQDTISENFDKFRVMLRDNNPQKNRKGKS